MMTLSTFLILVYAIPLMQFFFFPFRKKWASTTSLLWMTGAIEWVIGNIRDLWIALWALTIIVYRLQDRMVWGTWHDAALMMSCLILSRMIRRRRLRNMTEWILRYPDVSPKHAWRQWLAGLSPCGMSEKSPPVENDAHVSLGGRGPRRRDRLSVWIWGILATVLMTRLFIQSCRIVSEDQKRSLADVLMRMWGATVLQLSHVQMQVLGEDVLKGIQGPAIIVANHLSFFDFAVLPLVVLSTTKHDGRRYRLRFMAAKDHFLDNPILYRILGIGRAMEEVDMIFVDRKGKERNPASAVNQAASVMTHRDIDIALFPQGTRARVRRDDREWESYFSVGSRDRLCHRNKHLKKGVAYLALEMARMRHDQHDPTPVSIIPIGLQGVGIAAPKTGWKVRTGQTVMVNIQPSISIAPELLHQTTDEAVADIMEKVDRSLQCAVNIESRVRDQLAHYGHDGHVILTHLDSPWRDDLIWMMDLIFTQPDDFQTKWLARVASACLNGLDSSMISDLRRECVANMGAR